MLSKKSNQIINVVLKPIDMIVRRKRTKKQIKDDYDREWLIKLRRDVLTL